MPYAPNLIIMAGFSIWNAMRSLVFAGNGPEVSVGDVMRESSSHNALELGSIGLVEIGLMQIDREFYRKNGIWSWIKEKWTAKADAQARAEAQARADAEAAERLEQQRKDARLEQQHRDDEADLLKRQQADDADAELAEAQAREADAALLAPSPHAPPPNRKPPTKSLRGIRSDAGGAGCFSTLLSSSDSASSSSSSLSSSFSSSSSSLLSSFRILPLSSSSSSSPIFTSSFSSSPFSSSSSSSSSSFDNSGDDGKEKEDGAGGAGGAPPPLLRKAPPGPQLRPSPFPSPSVAPSLVPQIEKRAVKRERGDGTGPAVHSSIPPGTDTTMLAGKCSPYMESLLERARDERKRERRPAVHSLIPSSSSSSSLSSSLFSAPTSPKPTSQSAAPTSPTSSSTPSHEKGKTPSPKLPDPSASPSLHGGAGGGAGGGGEKEREKEKEKEDNPKRPSTPVVVLTKDEKMWVGEAEADGEMWIKSVAERRLRESERVQVIAWQVSDKGMVALNRERTRTKEKLITEVINVEKRLTKTWVDEVRQVVEDMLEKNKNTGKHFGIASLAEAALTDVMLSKENSSTQFEENNYDDDDYNVHLRCANANIEYVLDGDMKDRIKENMKVQLLGENWKERLRVAGMLNLSMDDETLAQADKTLLLEATANVWMQSGSKMDEGRAVLKKGLMEVMMGVLGVAVDAMRNAMKEK
jgi:hypothetical protein